MLDLAKNLPGTRIRIFSGIKPGSIKRAMALAVGEEGNNMTHQALDGGRGIDRLGTIVFAP